MSKEKNFWAVKAAAARAVIRADAADGSDGHDWINGASEMSTSINRVEGEITFVGVTMVSHRFAVHYEVAMRGESWDRISETGRVYA